MATYPVADECPACGCREYASVRTDRFVTLLSYDRVCVECDTRYTPRLSDMTRITVRVLGAVGGGIAGLVLPLVIDRAFFRVPGGEQGNLETFPLLLGMCCMFPPLGAGVGYLLGWALTKQPDGPPPRRRPRRRPRPDPEEADPAE